jgi:hypothetical protein
VTRTSTAVYGPPACIEQVYLVGNAILLDDIHISSYSHPDWFDVHQHCVPSQSEHIDPFSISVGAIGITLFALSNINKLRGILDGLDHANYVLQDVISDSKLYNIHSWFLRISRLQMREYIS